MVVKRLGYYREPVLAKYHEAANDRVQRAEAGVIQYNTFFRDPCFNQIVVHGNRFVVTSVFVVSADNDVIYSFAFIE